MGRLLYLEYLEARVFLSAQSVSAISELAHHNTTLAFQTVDFTNAFADTNGGHLTEIKFTTPLSHGTLVLNGSAVTVGQIIALADIPNLSYVPNNNYSGPDACDWNGSDGLAFADSAAQVSINVQEFAPTLTDVHKYVPLSTPTGFQASDFTRGFHDADPGDSLQAISITSLPRVGTLQSYGSPVFVGETFPDISGLTYTPGDNYTASDYFGWNAIDGSLWADSPATVLINDSNAPVVSDFSQTAHFNTPLSFHLPDFVNAFIDPVGGSLTQIKFTGLPTHGTLNLNGSAVALNQIIGTSDVANLSYVPNTNYSGQDVIGWNGFNGTLFAEAPASINITVLPATFTLGDLRKFVPPNTPTAFQASDFTAGFFGANPSESLHAIRVDLLPGHGDLLLSGYPVTQGQTIAVDQIANLTFVPATGYAGTDAFDWNASDGSNFADTGAHVNLFVSSTPVVFDINKAGHHNTTLTFTASDFSAAFLDLDTASLQQVKILSLPSNGTLRFNGQPVTQNQFIGIADVGGLTYVPNINYAGSDSLSWSGSDGDFLAATPANIIIDVQEAAPTVSDFAKSVGKNLTLAFSSADFAAAFSDTDPGDTLNAIQITALPTHGSLTLEGAAVILNQPIGAGLISHLTYAPDTNFGGSDVISWSGSDGTLFANASANVNIAVQSSAPTLSDVAKTTPKNTPVAFAAADFTGSFSDVAAGGTLQSLKIVNLPANGTLKLNGAAVTAAQIISVNQISGLTYTPHTGYAGIDPFSWNGSDGVLWADAPAAVNVTVTDTAPSLSAITLSDKQNGVLTLGSVTLTHAFTDADAGDTLVEGVITALPTYGTLKLSGVPVYSYQSVPLSQLGKLTYTPNSNFAGTETFYWSAYDGQLYAASNSITIHVAGKAPTVAPFTKGVIGNSTGMMFNSWDFTNAFTEPNIGPILRSITVASLPGHGTLTLGGANVTTGQVITANQIANLSYRPNSNYVGKDTFNWKGSDGVSTSASSAAVTLTVVSSTALIVTGNGNVIPTGSTYTSPVNFTDFGPIGYYINLDNQTDTRTYTITNNSAATITFTGAPKLIQIKGNTTDFTASSGFTDTLTHAPTTSLLPGHSATFTVTFWAQLALKRSATVIIPVASGAAYTFNVGGLGINTINNSDTNNFYGSPSYYGPSALNGLQYATTQAGTGPGAVEGQVLTMNYTGYLLDGTRFDSSLNPDRTPFQFYLGPVQLGDSNVIVGWNPGLMGIQVGEKRTLVIPSYIAYGTGGSSDGSIPPNSTLIFNVQCLAIGAARIGAGVTGSSTYISPQSTTASITEGTNFGALTATQSSLTVSYSLYGVGYSNASGQLQSMPFFTANTPITLTGPNASDFVLTATSSTYSVRFNKPADTKVRTARISVYTNDPVNPVYFYTIQASAAPYVDLTPTLGTTHLPASTTSGDRTNLALPLAIKNLGNTTSTGKTDIQIFALNTSTQTATLVTTLANQNLAGIGANKTKALTLNFTLPVGFAAGSYQFYAQCNASKSIAECNYTNNCTPNTTAITINQGLADLTGTLVSDTLPPALVSNAPINAGVTVRVANQGNVLLPANQQVTIVVVAHNVDTLQNTVLAASSPLSVASLKPGAASQFTVPIKNGAGLPAGNYILETQINPVQTLAESNTANNVVTQNASGQQCTILSAGPFKNLAGTFGTSGLPALKAAGTALSGKVNVIVTNFGNVALPAGQQIQLQLVARPAAGADVQLVLSPPLSVTALAPGNSKSFTLSVSLPAGLSAGSYTLRASIVLVQPLLESDTTDNIVTLNTAGTTIPLTII